MVKKILYLYSNLFRYPEENYKEYAFELLKLLKDDVFFKKFFEIVKDLDIFSLREIYTRTFDLAPSSPPYIGYHLFEDSYKKGEFLVKLKKIYEKNKFSFDERELPDHISILIDFINFKGFEKEDVKVILEEGLLPSLVKMKSLLSRENPYLFLMESLEVFLNRFKSPIISLIQNE
ncbi:MAG: molecular chaperone TorD family protein [candidate division WOR-3 bacterium]